MGDFSVVTRNPSGELVLPANFAAAVYEHLQGKPTERRHEIEQIIQVVKDHFQRFFDHDLYLSKKVIIVDTGEYTSLHLFDEEREPILVQADFTDATTVYVCSSNTTEGEVVMDQTVELNFNAATPQQLCFLYPSGRYYVIHNSNSIRAWRYPAGILEV